MSDTPEWKGGRVGPYEIGKRYPGIDEDEGRLYEARHVETGGLALAVMPGLGEDWRLRTPWEVLLFSRELRPSHPPRRAVRWGLASGAAALAVGLSLLLWPRAPAPPRTQDTPGELPFFAAERNPSLAVIAYPMPEKPFKEQSRPPCVEGREVEVRGGCWIPHKQDAPCPRGTAEHEGKCFVPVKKEVPPPSAAKP